MKSRILFFALLTVKILLFTYLSLFPTVFFGGGSDAEDYDAYAQGLDAEVPNIWPVLLRGLNDIGIYSRAEVSYLLAFLGIFVIPLLVAQLSVAWDNVSAERTFWYAALGIALYPTLFFYTFDIYRDVFMVFIFLLGLMPIKAFFLSASLVKQAGCFFLIVVFGYFLYLLRPYLGFAFLFAFLGCAVFSFKTAPLSRYAFLFLFVLNLTFAFGFLDPVLMYREIFDSMEGGADIGIRFESNVMFLSNFGKSFLYQIFGFYFPNYSSVVVFVFESIPFLVALIYLIKNRRYANSFASYLVIFFLIYSTIWVLGNDNLGTAVRLRMYSYISIFIAFLIVFQHKSKSASKNS